MGLFDGLFGRSRPPEADLDALFALPQAVLSLRAGGFRPTGSGAVCFRDAEGAADDAVVAEVERLLAVDAEATVDRSTDTFGYSWLRVLRTTDDVPSLVTDLHAVASSLTDAGFGSSLLCSTLGLTAPDGSGLALVYLAKRGTFYPFAPRTEPRRDNALELQVRGLVAADIPVEPELHRWLALWGAPT